MKNFIIFNSEKEGSCALVSILNNFKQTEIISDFIEPFDRHMFLNNQGALGKDITKEDFLKCLSMIYDTSENHLAALNAIYSTYNSVCKFKFAPHTSHGFKMRLRKQWNAEIFSLLKKYDVTAFVLIRQDVLRWALSKYHGNGKGNSGHLQFYDVTINDLPKIKVNWMVLKRIIRKCEERIAYRKGFFQDLRCAGVDAFPLYYEDFCNNRFFYFKQLLQKLSIEITDEEIKATVVKECDYKKVHPDDISTYVENHLEILRKYEAYAGKRHISPNSVFLRIPKIVQQYLF